MRQRAVFGQIVFSTSRSHAGNSQIYFRPSGDTSADIQAGVIVYICEFSSGLLRYAVRRVEPMGRHDVDKYAIYEDFPARRVSTRVSASLELIDPAWVTFFSWREDESHMVIIPIFPVRFHTLC